MLAVGRAFILIICLSLASKNVVVVGGHAVMQPWLQDDMAHHSTTTTTTDDSLLLPLITAIANATTSINYYDLDITSYFMELMFVYCPGSAEEIPGSRFSKMQLKLMKKLTRDFFQRSVCNQH